jgi:hypothetical protein
VLPPGHMTVTVAMGQDMHAWWSLMQPLSELVQADGFLKGSKPCPV